MAARYFDPLLVFYHTRCFFYTQSDHSGQILFNSAQEDAVGGSAPTRSWMPYNRSPSYICHPGQFLLLHQQPLRGSRRKYAGQYTTSATAAYAETATMRRSFDEERCMACLAAN